MNGDLIAGNNNTTNSTSYEGGGLAAYLSELHLNGVTVESNESGDHGGGIYVQSSTLVMSGSEVRSNRLRNNTAYGGGIRGVSSTIEVSDSLFYDNQGDEGGGAIYVNNGTLLVSGTLFEANNAKQASAIYAAGATTTLTNNVFVANTATSTGATVVMQSGTMTGSIFADNENTGSSPIAGALYVTGASSGTQVKNNTFVRTVLNGASADVSFSGGTLEFSDNILYGRREGTALTYTSSTVSGSTDNAYYYFMTPIAGSGETAVYKSDPIFFSTSDDQDFCNEDFHIENETYLDLGYGAYCGESCDWVLVKPPC